MESLIIVTIYSYILGSIPFGLIFSKILGFGDIRKIGSGNIGATNALRTGSKKLAFLTSTLFKFRLFEKFLTLLFDVGKGSLAVFLTLKYFNEHSYTSAIFVYLGHIFPLWLKFKGGKGVATYVGVILLINPILFLVFIFSWLLTAKILKVSSVSALVAYLIVTITSFFIYDQNIFLLNFFFLIFSIYTHRENIKRLMQKIEK